MDRIYTPLHIKSVSEELRQVEGWASTGAMDRDGDRLDPFGCEFDLEAVPVPFLLDHDWSFSVGEIVAAEVSSKGVFFRAQLPKIKEPGKAKEQVDYAFHSLKHGLRKSVSVGFLPLEAEPMRSGGHHIKRWQWLELSACSIPSNPQAQITSVKRAPRGTARRSTVRVPSGLPIVHVEPAPREKLPVVRLPGHALVARRAGDAAYEAKTGEKVPKSDAAREEWVKLKQIQARLRGVAWTGPDEMAEALRKAGRLPEPARSYRFADLATGKR